MDKKRHVKKTLTLLRHGEAAMGQGIRNDYHRALTPDGIVQLTRLKNLLVSSGVFFDFTLYSPAKRTTQTMELLAEDVALGEKSADRSIYEASLGNLLQAVHRISDSYHDVLVIGHNPGISHLQGYLSGDSSILFVPGMLVRLSLEVDSWEMVSSSTAHVLEVIQ
ncbi:MAG: histidine phosphatase family protein [Lunatimonas sp.]|uniref:SixA phosphatase family protein n=1 Tax=Lunatimonas sp. TaxID=2060141 RepID=UPI00263A727A|nr:histidine phosphatase family protein [Lunatimonas sp.]MCC5939312.1 histidine phosphatase family protein [Lunatimonas sp.]